MLVGIFVYPALFVKSVARALRCRAMDDASTPLDSVASEFATYEDFLDSQIAPVDLYYLEVSQSPILRDFSGPSHDLRCFVLSLAHYHLLRPLILSFDVILLKGRGACTPASGAWIQRLW